jgi:dephospho-CoA kinase
MWIMLEGLDRAGKSTIAELYARKGYEVVHMSAPDKKYTLPGYSGPSYLDDLLEMVMLYDGKDVVWDRTWMGETVWPHVYNRKPLLDDDDIEILQEYEARNNTSRILMIDTDVQAHWQRCVANKEPLTQVQFKIASSLYQKMAHKYNFIPQELKDFPDAKTEATKQNSSSPKQEAAVKLAGQAASDISVSVVDGAKSVTKIKVENELDKLEKANAIRDVLAKPLFKSSKTGNKALEALEDDVKNYLKGQLSTILGTNTADELTSEEVQILKLYCKQLKERAVKK